jgi:succinate dehydrogenase/fumarate reductase flavoprotein subunit
MGNVKELRQEVITADILVVGGGAGGLMAAITAAEHGSNVILCEKGNARRSGGIGSGNDHFMCYIPHIHGPALRRKFISDMLTMGMFDEDLVAKFVDRTYEVVQKWESWGANMKTNDHYEYVGQTWPGTSGKMGEPGKTNRKALHFSDDKLCVKLEKQARDRKIRIMNRVMISELLRDANGRVVGAIGISTREPEFYVFKTKNIVFNTGGVNPNRLYPSPNVIGYSMAELGTGDGEIMAYKIGADLQNGEFCNRQVSMRFGPWNGKGTWIGVVRDSSGMPIAPPYLSKPDAETGDPAIHNSDAIDHIWETGRGPVWMDPRGISEEDERYMRWGFESEAMHQFLRWADQEKIDIRKTRFEFTPRQMGTQLEIRIDINFKTSVEGLYSIFHRLLPWSAVGGLVAGEAAAKEVQYLKYSNLDGHADKISKLKQRYEELLNRKGQQYGDWREVQWALLQVMHCYALPPHRTENTLMAGYNQLLRIKELANKILRADNPHDLYHSIEVLNLMDIAELVLLAVNERKESRGQARRQDYPFTNPSLNQFLVITQKNCKPTFRWEKPSRLSEKM